MPVLVKNAIRDYLDKSDIILIEMPDNVFAAISKTDSSQQVDMVILVKAWKTGFIKIDDNGSVILLLAHEIPISWDNNKLRRKAEDYLRKQASVGDTVSLAIAFGALG